ncbi:uncharacterized protein LOC107024478 [Solanum pennellii]|uniref:Uncharacterized protein LOC107024478 n=1 Tax=Solanum pennellii TaxID=28526 RepID=A0ABM1H6B6_SOLPN|nr:uncharacterized protein LOC107024478 [Solanum pennellii]
MSNLSKLEFVALDISGKNYLSWVLDAEIHLTAKDFGDSIIEGNTASSLKGRYDHLKATVLPRARYEWIYLRFQDYKTQYREKGFQKYSELISYLLVAEQHNDLLMKNHEARPARSAPLQEAHTVDAHGQKGNKGGASSSKARVESHLTLKDDIQVGSSQKYNENVEANLALKDDAFDELDDITHLEAEDFFGDHN